MTPTARLYGAGQSLWLDTITRDLLTSGTLQRYIDELSLTGLTSNPTIYEKAIRGSDAYDGHIREGLEAGDPNEFYLQRLEAQAMSDNGAGLGYLTMINDYGATLAWRFHGDGAGRAVVTTQVKVTI